MKLRFAVLVVFIGGAVGAIAREILMLLVPTLSRGFPLDILVANVVASLLIGLVQTFAVSMNGSLAGAFGPLSPAYAATWLSDICGVPIAQIAPMGQT